MTKSEVYSWRVLPEIKTALEWEARRQRTTVAAILDRMVEEWLAARRASSAGDDGEQAALHAVAATTFGSMAGGNPRRAERARIAVRKRLLKRHDRRRPH